MEDKNDLERAIGALIDEVAGVKQYNEMAEHSKDAELKAIAESIVKDEKQHVLILHQYIAKKIQGIV